MDLSAIPKEIRDKKQWTYSYSKEEIKRPKHYKYHPDGGLELTDAVNMATMGKLSFGFYVTEHDEYILGDLDHIENVDFPFEELPVALAALLRTKTTYSEVSPSGEGIRFVFKLPSVMDKELLTGQTFYVRDPINDLREAQINIGQPWMRFTGNPTPFSSSVVGVVTLEELNDVFNIHYAEAVELDKKSKETDSKVPPLSEINNALMSLPMDMNPRIQRSYKTTFNQSYQHYDYWIKVMMGMHNFGEMSGKIIESLEAVNTWSRTDQEFQSDEDVLKHWKSFDEGDKETVSYKTVFSLAYNNMLRWPVPKNQKKPERDAGVAKKPLNTEYKNFLALVHYYDIRLYRDETNPNVVYVTADDDVVSKYFMMHSVKQNFGDYYGPFTRDTLIPAFHILCQDMGFIGIGHNQVSQFVKNYLAETTILINIVRLYFDTPFADLPPTYQENMKYYKDTTIDYIYSCLTIDYMTSEVDKEDKLYRAYYKSWIMGIARNMYFNNTNHMNNCVLLLTGPEQIRKTSHFLRLLPSFFRDYISLTPHGFTKPEDVRDITKIAASSMIVFWDEIEQYLTSATESNFKKIIDNNPQKMIDKYEIIEKTVRPTAIYGGTSNLREFKLGQEGSRRLFHIPIKWVDTDKLETVNWHKLINDMKEEIKISKNGAPWLLSKDQLEQQVLLHSGIRAKNNIDLALDEIFDFDSKMIISASGFLDDVMSVQNDTSGRLKSTKEVMDVLADYGVSHMALSRPAIIKSLQRLCGDFTGTRRYSKEIAKPKGSIIKGMLVQGNAKRWVVPDMRSGIKMVISGGSRFKDYVD